MTSILRRATERLELAHAYAGDGAVLSAIYYAKDGLKLLNKEKQRRIKIGLLPKEKSE
jgi:hypothetical protein